MFSVRWNVVIALALAAPALWGCGKSGQTQAATAAAAAPSNSAAPSAARAGDQPAERPADPVVVLHTTQGEITIQLFAEKAPRTVENFLRAYAERGFYDQTIFHHVEQGKMLIAGGYTADLERKPSRAPIYNESSNGLSNRRGTLAMIRDGEAPHSATSEFFINLTDNTDLDFKEAEPDDILGYCVFGEITSGMDVVERIAKLPTAAHGDFSQVPSPVVSIVNVKRLR